MYAQQKKAVSFQQQVKDQTATPSLSTILIATKYRILAEVTFKNSNASDFNDARSLNLWNTTTASPGKFDNLAGFNIGLSYLISSGYLGLEFGRVSQQLSNTTIAPLTTTVNDSIDIETLYLTHDWVYQTTNSQSFEAGLGIGYTTQFKFKNTFTTNGAINTLTWQANPFAAQVRFSYNYHFSHNVRFRANLGYEYITPSEVKTAEDYSSTVYFGQPLTSGQPFLDSNSQSVKADFSGAKAAMGIVIAF